MSRTVMIMAGGTGGHVMPGLAVAAEMRTRGWKVEWLGNPAGMEAMLVPKHGIPMRPVAIGGLRGKGLLTKLLLPAVLLRAFWQSLRALRAARPAVVLGMGGYVAFPGGMMASLTGRPLVVHEQNSVAGLTNRLLAKVADRRLEAFPGALPGARTCGNPVRADLAGLADPALRYAGRSGPLRLLVVGGSLGAQVLNETVPAAIAALPASARPQVVHQTGRGRRDEVERRYREAGLDAQVVEFIDDMATAYGEADLLVCRAGAMTVSEIAAAGVASVLVPFPHAVDDHQTANARYLSSQGAARLLPQSQLDASRLAALVGELDRGACAQMAARARALARPDAAAAVADACEEVALDK
ncbi:undecaprenyldiphospho-muramoylpentapeptide beta-N-acetylglucosaminyltransferase [Burkholderiaceae bacterium FT117]|uniref:undecaprenyldiphospho-muramoylpentapeptide beta-N-acetylglucosaminyltransferase n=1 Tax=Zeimonas sediminis TaxID=2944268 RepID=UPI00234315CD|nr:undecaprenyldiphospho-muramoylpentapeptide beta-N-acetylglucosaminyltransferase [Zeimonas sediminis]MCM5570783.1 undecaprenyldiphospho-muramoylpentapeptide beta-N-acetylglucosaminyltransferase [Zeimonas sediminis]